MSLVQYVQMSEIIPIPDNPRHASDSLFAFVSSAVEGAGHAVMFVDDEPSIVKSLYDSFRLKYEVLTATSADEADVIMAARGDKSPIAAVVSDQRMPGRSGADLFAKMWRLYPTTTRVLCTGYASFDDLCAAVNRGHIYHVVKKPFGEEEINQVLREAVAASVLMQNLATR